MDGIQMERVAAILSARRSRRAALVTGAAVAIVATAIPNASAQQATPAGDAEPSLLFVQSFDAGSVTSEGSDPDIFTLVVSDPARSVLYFSDRPNRIVGIVALEKFAKLLTEAGGDPPNAALVMVGDAGEQIAIVELSNPQLDVEGSRLTYDARQLTSGDVDMEFHETPIVPLDASMTLGESHLFIDGLTLGGCTPWDPRC